MLKAQALELRALGYGSIQAAQKLGVGRHRTRIIYQEINEEWRSRLLSSLLTDAVPLEWATSIELNRLIIRKCWEIYDATADFRVKTECLRLASDTSHRTSLLIGDSQKIGRSISKVLVLSQQQPPSPPPSDDGGDTADTDQQQQQSLELHKGVSEGGGNPQQKDGRAIKEGA
jgi:hypothetical protein